MTTEPRAFRTRIRAVRDKATGREVRVISPHEMTAAAAEMVHEAGKIARAERIVAYAVVAMNDRGAWFWSWDTGQAIPMRAFPYAVADALVAGQADVDEDFRVDKVPSSD